MATQVECIPHALLAYLLPVEATSHSPQAIECAKCFMHDPKGAELWGMIAERYDDEGMDSIAAELPQECAVALAVFAQLPKLTPGEWRRSRQHLASRAEQLARELERFFDRFEVRDGGTINLSQLIDDAPASIDLPEIMRRIAALFREDADMPPLQRPRGKHAQRNYFARHLIRYFMREWGDMSPGIVARITSLFFAQGITDNEVSKQALYMPDGRRIPWRRETSTPK